jgi:hypothetical protein
MFFPDFEETAREIQHTMFLSWSAVHYNLVEPELFIMHESMDLRPDYPLLSNLPRQVPTVRDCEPTAITPLLLTTTTV